MKIIHHFKNQENLNLNEKRKLTDTNTKLPVVEGLQSIMKHFGEQL